MLARTTAIACCAAAVAFAATRLHEQRRCESSSQAVFLAPARASAATLARVRGCRDAQALADAAVALDRAGRHAPALAFARTAVARAPQGFAEWVGLALVEQARDPAAAARAQARAKALNPRWPGLAPAAPGRAGAGGP